jgi:hypothetical protein
MADRQEWDNVTAATRHLAIAADAELRRRHPDTTIKPMRSAEPAPVSDAERASLRLTPENPVGQGAVWIQDLAIQRQVFRSKIKEHQNAGIISEETDPADISNAFSARRQPGSAAVLQPPKPQMAPSAKIFVTGQVRN